MPAPLRGSAYPVAPGTTYNIKVNAGGSGGGSGSEGGESELGASNPTPIISNGGGAGGNTTANGSNSPGNGSGGGGGNNSGSSGGTPYAGGGLGAGPTMPSSDGSPTSGSDGVAGWGAFNTGRGGGGVGDNQLAGQGASGIVMLRYPVG